MLVLDSIIQINLKITKKSKKNKRFNNKQLIIKNNFLTFDIGVSRL